MIQEVIGLGLERVGAHSNKRVGKLGIFVAIVELAHAHVAGGVDFRIISRPIVNPDILHLHGAEVELASAPGVFITAAGAAMVEGRDEHAIFAHVIHHCDRHARDEVERIVPARRLHLPITPDHRVREALQLRIALL